MTTRVPSPMPDPQLTGLQVLNEKAQVMGVRESGSQDPTIPLPSVLLVSETVNVCLNVCLKSCLCGWP